MKTLKFPFEINWPLGKPTYFLNSCYSCGEVTDVYITEKGYAFVTMADEASADAAIKELNQAVIDGQEIKVDHAWGREPWYLGLQ